MGRTVDYGLSEAQSFDAHLRPFGYTLFDAYQIEDVERLRRDLLRLLPGLGAEKAWMSNDALEMLDSFETGGWTNLGYVAGPGRWGLGGMGGMRRMELPREVDFVHLKLHRVSPSLFVVSYSVRLRDFVGGHLRSLLKEEAPEPSIRLSHLKFWSPYVGMSGGNPMAGVQARIQDWHDRTILEIERQICSKVRGRFYNDVTEGRSRLPCVREFFLIGPRSLNNELVTEGRFWFRLHGLEHAELAFANDHKAFLVDTEYEGRRPNVHNVIKLYRGEGEYSNEGTGTAHLWDLAHRVDAEVDALVPDLAIHEYISRTFDEANVLRRNIFKSIGGTLHTKRMISLSREAVRIRAVVERNSVEMKNFAGYRSSTSYDDLKMGLFYRPLETEFRKSLVKSNKKGLKRVDSVLDDAWKACSDYLQIANIRTQLHIQVIVIIFAIVGLLLTAIQAASAWRDLYPPKGRNERPETASSASLRSFLAPRGTIFRA